MDTIMQVKYKQHIMDEISDQVHKASEAKKRIDVITLDEHEWTEFKLYMRTKKAKEENNIDVSGVSDSFMINGIIVKPEDIIPRLKIK